MVAKRIKTNVVFNHLTDSRKFTWVDDANKTQVGSRFVIEQGGTRSGKTYNILTWLIFGYALAIEDGEYKHEGTITIARKTFPALRATVMRDFFEILESHGIYDDNARSRTEHTYKLGNIMFEFLSVDAPQKIRGRKRNILIANECNELDYEDFFQLIIRTTEFIIIDYNPSDEFHWIYDRIIPRNDAVFHQTTYLDNPFIDKSLIQEIERLKEVDENYWKVYGLGERGQSKALIFSHDQVDDIPSEAKLRAYGLDFGFTNDPTALIALYEYDGRLYFDEMLYRNGMTNADIANFLKGLNLDRRDLIWADSSEPKSIEEIHRMGWNIRPVTKGADSINLGIDIMRRYKLIITSRSVNLVKEFRNYKYIEDKNGTITNKPIDAFNHGIDAARYACMMTYSRPNIGKYAIR